LAISSERVLLAFRQLFRHQLATSRDGAILRGNMERGRVGAARRIGSRQHCRSVVHGDAVFFGNASDKAFEILLLDFGKARVLRHRSRRRQ
jgi:hypothetical protein